MSATRQGPALTIAGTCEGCRWLLTGVRDPALIGRHSACTHPTRNDGGTIFARSSKAPMMPEWCPLLPAARLALARSICNHCGADIAPDYLGLYAKPTCEKCANERTGDTSDGPLCADCGDPLADPTTAEECSIRHGAGESEE